MALRMGLALIRLDFEELWFRYLELGGSLSRHALCTALDHTTALSALEHNMAAHALNERLIETEGLTYPVTWAAELDPSHEPR